MAVSSLSAHKPFTSSQFSCLSVAIKWNAIASPDWFDIAHEKQIETMFERNHVEPNSLTRGCRSKPCLVNRCRSSRQQRHAIKPETHYNENIPSSVESMAIACNQLVTRSHHFKKCSNRNASHIVHFDAADETHRATYAQTTAICPYFVR